MLLKKVKIKKIVKTYSKTTFDEKFVQGNGLDRGLIKACLLLYA